MNVKYLQDHRHNIRGDLVSMSHSMATEYIKLGIVSQHHNIDESKKVAKEIKNKKPKKKGKNKRSKK